MTMDEKNKDTELEGMMAQEPSLAEMPLTELKEVDYTFGNRDFGYPSYPWGIGGRSWQGRLSA